jgi:hypothetical protein
MTAIAEAARLGYLRGVLDELAAADREDAAAVAWTEPLRQLAQRFAFDALRERLTRIDGAADAVSSARGPAERAHG